MSNSTVESPEVQVLSQLMDLCAILRRNADRDVAVIALREETTLSERLAALQAEPTTTIMGGGE